MLVGLISTIGLNIVSRRMLHFALSVICSRKKNVGGDSFVKGGFRNWNRYDSVDKHVGSIRSVHNRAQEKYNFFVKPTTSIA